MSVMTMTLHQAQQHSRQAPVSTLPFSHCSRGTKRSREYASESDSPSPERESLSRTMKRTMSLTPHERQEAAQQTFRKLFTAQRELAENPVSHLLQGSDTVCVDCGQAKHSPQDSMEECQRCGSLLCSQCSLTVYLDNGDYRSCLACSHP